MELSSDPSTYDKWNTRYMNRMPKSKSKIKEPIDELVEELHSPGCILGSILILYISTFRCHSKSLTKDTNRKGHRINSHFKVANSAMVVERHENIDATANSVTQRKKNIETTKSTTPSLPIYTATWDIVVILKYLAIWHPVNKRSLKNLTLMLLALLSRKPRQTFHALPISAMQLCSEKCVLMLNSLLKTSKPGKHLSCLEFFTYKPDCRLCIVRYVAKYVKRTQPLRQYHDKLLVS